VHTEIGSIPCALAGADTERHGLLTEIALRADPRDPQAREVHGVDNRPCSSGQTRPSFSSIGTKCCEDLTSAYSGSPLSSPHRDPSLDTRLATANIEVTERLAAFARSPSQRQLDKYNEAIDQYRQASK
jgi:hypothetical protein